MDWFEAGANLEVVAEMGSGRCIKEDLSVCKLQEKVSAEMIRRNYLHQKEKQKTGTLTDVIFIKTIKYRLHIIHYSLTRILKNKNVIVLPAKRAYEVIYV